MDGVARQDGITRGPGPLWEEAAYVQWRRSERRHIVTRAFLAAVVLVTLGWGCRGDGSTGDSGTDSISGNGGASGENTLELCTDSQDNDGDNRADCSDPECSGFSACVLDSTPDAGQSDGGENQCDPSVFTERIAAFCQTQNPPTAEPRELGASCAGDDGCDTDGCHEPYGQPAYCSIECPQGDECPQGYNCQDTGTSGPWCYRSVCVYIGSDLGDCVANLTDASNRACRHTDCNSQFDHWLDCLVEGERFCSSSEVDEACGVELGLLRSCCPDCLHGY